MANMSTGMGLGAGANPGALSPLPLATDARSLEALRGRAAISPKTAVHEAARQFEALFMNELVKSMRATTLQSNEGGQAALGTDMLDSQLALQMSGQKGGLSEAIGRYLERQMGLTPGPIPSTANANTAGNASAASLGNRPTRLPQSAAASFVEQHTGAARVAEAQTGIPATFMVAQAAHETGWGRKEIRHTDGSPSFNLFGIKAGGSWKGPVAEVATTEYVNGQPRRVMAKFRAYSSYAESFSDYARLMKDSPRYQGVVAAASRAPTKLATVASAGGAAVAKVAANAAGFAQGLQKAGYATDPAYADKLTRVINTTLRLQRSLTA